MNLKKAFGHRVHGDLREKSVRYKHILLRHTGETTKMIFLNDSSVFSVTSVANSRI